MVVISLSFHFTTRKIVSWLCRNIRMHVLLNIWLHIVFKQKCNSRGTSQVCANNHTLRLGSALDIHDIGRIRAYDIVICDQALFQLSHSVAFPDENTWNVGVFLSPSVFIDFPQSFHAVSARKCMHIGMTKITHEKCLLEFQWCNHGGSSLL